MKPLFIHQPVLLGALVASLVLWRLLESGIDIISFQRLRQGSQRQDQGSHIVLLVLAVGGLALGTLVAFDVPATTITLARPVLSWLGIALILAGIALRLYAMRVLGKFFTTSVAVAANQTVVETGPYHLIRHPSYTGFLIIVLGFALCLTNWFSLLIILVCALLGVGYRMRVEEHVLIEHLGQPYHDYMQRTKRLIPFVY